jgi:hypothetical protein
MGLGGNMLQPVISICLLAKFIDGHLAMDILMRDISLIS